MNSLRQITITHEGIPSLNELANLGKTQQHEIGYSWSKDSYTWEQATQAFQVHAAIREMLQLHARLGAAREDDLIDFLRDGGFRGKRGSCGECPLANAYFYYLTQALDGLNVTTHFIDVSQHSIELEASAENWVLKMVLPSTEGQARFIKEFDDDEEHAELDEEDDRDDHWLFGGAL